MDLAVKKIELIEWLARVQDEKIIHEIEALKEKEVKTIYEVRMPKTSTELQTKIDQSEKDIKSGRVFGHSEVESYFKAKFSK